MSKNLEDLLPLVKEKANEFLSKCKEKGYTISITSTYRSPEEQDTLYAQGRTAPGNVVTNSKAGGSFHNYRVAFDFVPLINGQPDWSDKSLFTKIGEIGESCGLEWGGRWTSFIDIPHLQYTAGYTLKDFQNNTVDVSKFELPVPPAEQVLSPYLPEKLNTKDEMISLLNTFLATFGASLLVSLQTFDWKHITAGTLLALVATVVRVAVKSTLQKYL